MALKEKDIINYLYDNWLDIFPEMKGCKKEYVYRNSRVDIFSSFPVDLFQLGIREEDDELRHVDAAVFAEVKYNNNDRDLLFELQKHINFRDWYIKEGKSFCLIIVIADNFNDDMVQFMKQNNIIMYKFKIDKEDLNTIEFEEYLGEV